ncbi:hypothetical protein, variant [Salpingoeca rosetta]|nr:hypothetical protein, variant [Salpingoeca rosetta]EGD78026.1 hypothetical protein, variant [Salpingoeca rosetta]|eukprot:XP_004990088.1 hypothetical protein, variant [Salpingoeca rosetta]
MYDCTVFSNMTTLLRLVAYRHSCFGGFAHLDDDFPTRCTEHRLTKEDKAQLYQLCTRAPARIIKTIRFRNELMLMPKIEGLRIVHLIRRPFHIAKGQYLLGWPFKGQFSKAASAVLAQAHPQLSPHELNLGGIALDKTLDSPHIVVKYEDILAHGPDMLGQLVDFVMPHHSATEADITAVYRNVSQHTFVNFKKLDPLMRTAALLGDDEWERLALAHSKSCRHVYRRFGYMAPHLKVAPRNRTTTLDNMDR